MQRFYVAILLIRAIYCRKLAQTRLAKELKAFFAFAESLPPSASLISTHYIFSWKERRTALCLSSSSWPVLRAKNAFKKHIARFNLWERWKNWYVLGLHKVDLSGLTRIFSKRSLHTFSKKDVKTVFIRLTICRDKTAQCVTTPAQPFWLGPLLNGVQYTWIQCTPKHNTLMHIDVQKCTMHIDTECRKCTMHINTECAQCTWIQRTTGK